MTALRSITAAPAATAEPACAAAAMLIGSSAQMIAVRQLVGRVARSNAAVLVTGPSGSGKEVVARAIHAAGPRRDGPFVAVNCGAIPADLIESELFGHEKGAFTGAIAQRRGRFEQAAGGTLFFDELGEMPPAMQVRLLRVLEERSFERVGGHQPIASDARIIAATHRDLDAVLADGRLREDLFYRLSVVTIALPPLAERTSDLPELTAHLSRAAAARDGGPAPVFGACAMARLMAHDWPGNVRELRNVVERARILIGNDPVTAGDVPMLLAGPRGAMPSAALPDAAPAPPSAQPCARDLPPALTPGPGPVDLRAMVLDLERRHIIAALDAAQGVVADAARLVSLNRTTFLEKMRRHAVRRPGADNDTLVPMH